MVYPRPTLPDGQSTNGKTIKIAELLHKEERSETHIKLPRLGVLHQEDKQPECLALKTRET